MKFLYMIFVAIFISGSFAFSQGDQKDENSFPKFIPYESGVCNLQDSSAKIDIREYWQDQPAHWLSVDPLANKYPGWSPYNYVSNNPIRNIDLDGRRPDEFEVDREQGKITKVSDKGGNKTDYYDIGKTEGKDEFKTEQVIAIDRGDGTINSFRFRESDNSTISAFNIPAENISGNILQPPGPSTSESGLDQRIPEGSYSLMKNDGSKFPNNFKLFNDDVSPSRGILIHSGNYPQDTHGCLLPGSGWGTDHIEQGTSRDMVKTINSYINEVGVSNVDFNIFNIIR